MYILQKNCYSNRNINDTSTKCAIIVSNEHANEVPSHGLMHTAHHMSTTVCTVS